MGLSSLLLKLNVKSKQFKETNKKMMRKWKVIIMKKMILSILTKTLLKIIHKILNAKIIIINKENLIKMNLTFIKKVLIKLRPFFYYF